MRTTSLTLLVTTLLVAPLAAEGQEKLPRRPELPAAADTNDANAYFQYGMMRLVRHPTEAADAFYWATRLSPAWADPYYGRRTALLMARRNMLWGYFTGQRGIVNSRQVRSIDSLAKEALIRNPFYAARFDLLLIEEALRHEYGPTAYLDRMRSGDAALDAMIAYGDGRYRAAVDLYGQALKRRPREFGYRLPRARAFFHLLELDSAANEMTLLLEEMRKRDDKTLVYFYDSKEVLEYSLGRVYYLLDRNDDARAALGRALEEDLSFYMAHVDLAEIALKQGDTTTALSELSLAVEIRAADAAVRLRDGDALVAAGMLDDAVAQYRAAIEHEPYFAQPYFELARALDLQGNAREAVEQYRAFLARSARNRAEIAAAQERITALADSERGSPP